MMYQRALRRLLVLVFLVISLTTVATVQRPAPVHAADGPAHLVKDINTAVFTEKTQLSSFASVGNLLFFLAVDPINGQNVWRSDGTTAGTYVLTHNQNPHETPYISFTAVGNRLFFMVSLNDEPGMRPPFELWTSDGSVLGTVRMGQFTGCGYLVAVGTTFFFAAADGTAGCELWKSDGTAAGTVRVADIAPGAADSNPTMVTTIGARLFFKANDGSGGYALWSTDGTAAGTLRLTSLSAALFATSAVIQNTLFFTVDDATSNPSLWKSDGTAAGTVQVANFPLPEGGAGPSALTAVGNTLFFVIGDELLGTALWKSDGTTARTVKVADIHAPHRGAGPARLCAVGSTLFFVADDGSTGVELWKSNGTAAGTGLVKDLDPRYSEGVHYDSNPSDLTAVDNTLFFTTVINGNVGGLWRSDGTAAGTTLVNNGQNSNLLAFKHKLYFVAPDAAGGKYGTIYRLWSVNAQGGPALVSTTAELRNRLIQVVGDTLFFTGGSSAESQGSLYDVPELWKTDGTSAGTARVKTFSQKSGEPTDMAAFNNKLFFSAHGGAQNTGLWQSDGTAAQTTLVKGSATYGLGIPRDLTVVNNTLFFASEGSTDEYLWKSDGTLQGTTVLTDAYTSWRPLKLTSANNKLFFLSWYGNMVWVSDGTVKGTQPLAKAANELVALGNSVVFVQSSSALWRSDGTAAGTTPVIDFRNDSGYPESLTTVGTNVFFTLYRPGLGTDVWKTDGTTAGTVRVATGDASNLTAAGNTLFFIRSVTNGFELWKSDGTTAGTVRVTDTPFSYEKPDNPERVPLMAIGNSVFFGAYDPIGGRELWKSDGTAAGTVRVKDINPGPSSSAPINMTNIGGRLLFSAYDPDRGYELWQSNGTEAGTTLVQDINVGFGNSNPQGFTLVGDQVFFQAFTSDVGAELWTLPVSALGTAMPPASATPTSAVTSTPLHTSTPTSTAVGPTSIAPTASATALPTVDPLATSSPTTPNASSESIGTAGGTVTSPDGSVTLTFPPGAVLSDTTVTFTAISLPVHGLPTNRAALRGFALHAATRDGTPVTQFAQPYTLTLTYTDAERASVGVRANTLNLAYWNGTAWVPILPCAECSLDVTHHRITAQLDHFTGFAVLGETEHTVYLPLATR